MRAYRVSLTPAVETALATLHPEIKRAVRNALEAIASDPKIGMPLGGELTGLNRYKVRRFRIVYEIVPAQHVVRVVAIGHRRDIYEDLVGERRR